MSHMSYIRDRYSVPAKRGGKVTFQGQEGEILSAKEGRLVVRMRDGAKLHIHPTWEVVYIEPRQRP